MNKRIIKILDDIKTLIESGELDRKTIKKRVKISFSQIREWVFERSHTPSSENLMKLDDFLRKYRNKK